MATATKKVARRKPGSQDQVKAAQAKAAPATASEDSGADTALEEANKAAQEAREAQRAQALQGVAETISDALYALREGDNKSAMEERQNWVKIGRALIEGRSQFIAENSNQPNDKAFGNWIADNGFSLLGQRPSRAAAIWLANVHDTKPELWDLFPTEREDDKTPLRRSPRTLKQWVTEQVNAAFQSAWEAGGVNAPSEAGKEAQADVAKEEMPNVYEALAEQLDAYKANLDAANVKLANAKSPAERKAASAEVDAAEAIYNASKLQRDILDTHTDEERLSMFVAWKPARKATAFKDADIDEAAGRLFALLSTHPEFGEVYAALGRLVQEKADKVAADAGAVSDGGASDFTDDPDTASDIGMDTGDDLDSEDGDDDFDDADFGDDFDGEADDGDGDADEDADEDGDYDDEDEEGEDA